MQDTLWSFRLLGFDVNVQPTFGLLAGIFVLFELQGGPPINSAGGAANQALMLAGIPVIILFSIVIHELGHALMIRRFRVPVGPIELHGMGGHVSHGRTSPKNQLAISLAGPGAGLLFGVPLWFISSYIPYHPVVNHWIGWLLFVNIGWSIFNLMPIRPMDGGNALRSMLALKFPVDTTEYASGVVGLLTAVLLALVAWKIGAMIMAVYFAYFAYQNWQIMSRYS